MDQIELDELPKEVQDLIKARMDKEGVELSDIVMHKMHHTEVHEVEDGPKNIGSILDKMPNMPSPAALMKVISMGIAKGVFIGNMFTAVALGLLYLLSQAN